METTTKIDDCIVKSPKYIVYNGALYELVDDNVVVLGGLSNINIPTIPQIDPNLYTPWKVTYGAEAK